MAPENPCRDLLLISGNQSGILLALKMAFGYFFISFPEISYKIVIVKYRIWVAKLREEKIVVINIHFAITI